MNNTKQWKITPQGNAILQTKDFYISYNSMVDTFITSLPCFMSDDGMDETALCYKDDFFILNGDFREAYEELVDQGFDACYQFYLSKKDQYGSSWSD